MLIVPKVSKKIFIELILGKKQPSQLVCRLYRNQVELTSETKLIDFEELTQESGYQPQPFNSQDWVIDVGGFVVASHPEIRFDFTAAAGSIQGYYITSEGDLMWAEKFNNGPYMLNAPGDVINITPTITFG